MTSPMSTASLNYIANRVYLRIAGTTTGRQSNEYKISNAKKLPEHLGTQAAFIVAFLRKGPATRVQIAKAAKRAGQNVFPCSQDHERAVGFYLSKFKTMGALKFNNR